MSEQPGPGLQPDPRPGLDLLRRLGGVCHLTALKPDPVAGQANALGWWHHPDREKATAAWIARMDAEGRGIYWQTGGVRDNFGGAKAADVDIVTIRAVYTEIDPRPGETPEQMMTRIGAIQAMANAPSVIIHSGNGIQLVWLLDTAEPIEPERAVEVNKSLCAFLGGDRSAHDLSRLLRLPGTINYPNAKKRAQGRIARRAELAGLNSYNYRYDELDDVVEEAGTLGQAQGWAQAEGEVHALALPEADEAAIKALARRWLREGGLPQPSPELVRRVDAAVEAADGGAFVRRWSGDASLLADDSRSTRDYALVHAALAAGIARHEDEAACVLQLWAEGGAAGMGWSGVGDTDKYPMLRDQVRYVARCVARSLANLAAHGQGPTARAAAVEALPIEAKEAMIPIPGAVDSELIVDQLNADGWCLINDRPGILLFTDEMLVPTRVRLGEMRTRYQARLVLAPHGPRGQLAQRNMADIWLEHPKQRTYTTIDQQFYGVGQRDPLASTGAYNLFRGWTPDMLVAAKRGAAQAPLTPAQWPDAARLLCGASPGDAVDLAWRFLYEFLFGVMCIGAEERVVWVVNGAAHLVQRPHEAVDVYLVLADIGGTGKDMFAKLFLESLLPPRNYLMATNKEQVFGRFNAHLAPCLVIGLNEATWAGDPRDKGHLKGLVGGPRRSIEAKYQTPFALDVRPRVFLLTNNRFAAPIDPADRRVVIFAPSTDWKGQLERFARLEREQGLSTPVWQAVVCNLAPERPTQLYTVELAEQVAQQIKGVAAWLFQVLDLPSVHGIADPDTGKRDWPKGPVNYLTLFLEFTAWQSRYRPGYGEDYTQAAFSQTLAAMLKLNSWVKTPAGGKSERWVHLPSQAQARALLDAHLEGRLNWGVPVELDPEAEPPAW